MQVQTFPWSDVISVEARWGLREESAEDCAARLGQMLEALESLHDGFPRLMWTGGPMRPVYPLPTRFEELARLFEHRRIYDDIRKRRLSDGFSFSADARLGGKRFIQLHVWAGKHVDCGERIAWPNAVFISTVIYDPDGEDRAIVEAMRPALEAVTGAWTPDRAATFSRNRAATRHDPAGFCFYNGARHIYLNPRQAQQVAASRGTAIETLCEGGCRPRISASENADPPQCQLNAVIQQLIAATAS